MATVEGWVRVKDVAAHLRVGKDAVHLCANTKDFPAQRVGRLPRFRLSEVDKWVKTADGDGLHNPSKATRKVEQEW